MRWSCPICGNFVREPGRETHEECSMARLFLDDPYDMLSKGEVDTVIRDFVPELDFPFEEDWRTKKFFNLAEQVIFTSIYEHSGGDFPLQDLGLDRPPSEIKQIFDVLNVSGVAYLDGSQVRLGSLGGQICDLVPSGEPLDSPAIRKRLEEIRGWITITVGKTMLDLYVRGQTSIGRPRNLLLVTGSLSNISREYEYKIPLRRIPVEVIFNAKSNVIDSLHVSDKQFYRLMRRMMGFRGKPPKIYGAFYASVGNKYFDLKPVSQIYCIREYERWRERERERGRR